MGTKRIQGLGDSSLQYLHKMIQHPGLQAVWVSTSTDVHAPQTIAAIEKGLNVLCEKPLSTDTDEVRDYFVEFGKGSQLDIKLILQQSTYRPSRSSKLRTRTPHLKVMAGFSRRFDASYRNAKAKIIGDAIGEPFIVRS